MLNNNKFEHILNNLSNTLYYVYRGYMTRTVLYQIGRVYVAEQPYYTRSARVIRLRDVNEYFHLVYYLRMQYSFYFDIRIVGAYIRILFAIRFL